MKPSVFSRLSLQDAVNLATESANASMEIGALVVLEAGPISDPAGRLRLHHLRLHVRRRLAGAPELLRRIKFPGPFGGRPVWVDDAGFDVDRHVLAQALPAPGGEAELLAAVSKLMAARLDLRYPPWQMWFLPGLEGGRVGLLIKLHHVLADGRATVNFAASLLDLARIPSGPGLPDWTPAPAPGYGELVLDNLAGMGRALRRAVRALVHPGAAARALEGQVARLRMTWRTGRGAPRLSINRPVAGGRELRVMRLPLDAVKAAAHAHGAKVNDVLLDVIAGGIQELLGWRGEPVEGVCLHASVAVSFRSQDDRGRSGNEVGSVVVRVPLDLPPGERLARIAAASRQAREEQGGGPAMGFVELITHLGLANVVMRHQHLVNILVSNLAGPPVPLYLMGARALEATAITPIAGNVGLGFGALSYAGRFSITVVADSAQVADVDVLLSGMRRTWDDLAAPPGRSTRAGRALRPISRVRSGPSMGREP